LVSPPLRAAQPTWEDDDQFDIRNHIVPVSLPKPGTEEQLMRLAGTLFEGVLDRDKPLWKIHVVNGLEGNRSALVSLVHHCMVDGVSGAELWGLMVDTSPDAIVGEPAPYEPSPRPPKRKQLLEAMWDTLTEQIDNWSELQRDMVGLARSTRGDQAITFLRQLPKVARDVTRPIKKLPFNGHALSGKRRLSWSACSFAEVRAIRKVTGGTLNDVVLAALGGALKKYMEHHGIGTRNQTVRIMVPVSVRSDDQRGALGNKVSMLAVDIPVDGDDPIERLRAVGDRTTLLKQTRFAEILETLNHYWQGTPALWQEIAGTAFMSWPVQRALDRVMMTPGLHMVCTNVPGPQIPLYVQGQKILAHIPLLPVGPGMGLNMGVFSYNQQIFFGFIADTGVAPDVRRFNRFVDEAFAELRTAAGVEPIEAVPIGIRTRKVRRGSGRNKSATAPSKEAVGADR
jgi:diacylglycerol O-acyltransferase / wax synthase